MPLELEELKARILALLKEDDEFRYAVAGLIGLEEILRRMDKYEEQLVKLREDMVEGFKRHDEMIAKLREDMTLEFKRHNEEMAKLREDMVEGFKRHDEMIAKLREDMTLEFKRHDEEMARLRADMNEGFSLLRRNLEALGARWGLMAEDAFKEGLRGLLEKEVGLAVSRWTSFDDDGTVFGYPCIVDVDVAIRDGKTILVEVKSHVNASDVYTFKRKAELYERKTGQKPARLIMVTPYTDDKAREAALKHNIEIYTKV